MNSLSDNTAPRNTHLNVDQPGVPDSRISDSLGQADADTGHSPMGDGLGEVPGTRISEALPSASPSLYFVIDGEHQDVELSDFGQSVFDNMLIGQVRAARDVVAVATCIYDWPENALAFLLSILKEKRRVHRLRIDDDPQEYVDPYEAVLAHLVGPSDFRRHAASRRAIVLAAAIYHPDAIDAIAPQITDAFAQLGAGGVRNNSIAKEIRTIREGQAHRVRATRKAEEFIRYLHDAMQHAVRESAAEHELPQRKVLNYFQDEFYQFNGKVWHRMDEAALKARLVGFLQGGIRETEVTSRFVNDVITNIKGQALLDFWDEQPPFGTHWEGPKEQICRPRLVVLNNGIVDFDEILTTCDNLSPAMLQWLGETDGRTPRLYGLTSEYFCTTMLPFDYQPEADCPLWEQTLSEILERDGEGDRRIELLQEFVGWAMIPNGINFEKFLVMVGEGSNGKSTLLNVIIELLGRDNVSHVDLSGLREQFMLEPMRGKLANIAADMQRLERADEGMLKKLTSSDMIQVNRKNKAPMPMKPTGKLLFACNELPPISDRSDGVWRRLIAMPFNKQFRGDQIDVERVAKLLQELPGIFNWALEGARRLYAQGGFTRCQVCEACGLSHRMNSDVFMQFEEDHLQLNPDGQIRCNLLYNAYVNYCGRNGRVPVNSSQFGQRVLRLQGVTRVRESTGERKTCYRGVALVDVSGQFNGRVGVDRSTRPWS